MATQRVLIVDDDPNVATVTAEMVRALGHNAVVAWSADSALALWKETAGAFDLVIVDYLLGRGSGAKVAVKIARDNPDIPIILTSGLSEDNVDLPDSRVRFLQKPFSVPRLKHVINESLAEKSNR
ncbi:MAG: response regulator [Limisphaerales bacterium]